MSTLRIACFAMLAAAATAAVPSTAHAWWRGGVWFGVAPLPFYVAPPPVYYAPPPVVYAPPPVMYTPPAASTAAAASCGAGPYICPLDRPLPIGAACSCPTNNGGRVGGIVH